MTADLLDQTRAEFDVLVSARGSPSDWKICVFRNSTVDDGPRLESLDYGDKPDLADAAVAEEAARVHAQVLGDRQVLDGPPGSILAVPVFDPNVFQPSPVLRPVRAVVNFGSCCSAIEIGANQALQLIAEKYANLLADTAFGQEFPAR